MKELYLDKRLSGLYLQLVQGYEGCQDCPLHEHRKRVVHIRGDVPCTILYVGEAPGETEDALGFPMTGPTRRVIKQVHSIFHQMLQEHRLSASEPRISYAITNLVACRPLDNRTPTKEECLACRDRLHETILLASGLPVRSVWMDNLKVVVAMGQTATNYISLPEKLGKKKVAHTTHPAHVVRLQYEGKHRQAHLVVRNIAETVCRAYLESK